MYEQNNKSEEIEECIKQLKEAEEGDVISPTMGTRSNNVLPYEIGEKLGRERGRSVNEVFVNGEVGDMGIENSFYNLDGKVVRGSYGHKNRPVDKCLRVKEVGKYMRAEYVGGFNESIFKQYGFDQVLSDEQIEEIVGETIFTLDRGGHSVIGEQIFEQGVRDIRGSVVKFNTLEPSNWFSNREYQGKMQKIADDAGVDFDNLMDAVRAGITSSGEYEFQFDVELVE